jgi:hypothetical protein
MTPEEKKKAIDQLYTYKRYYQDFEAYAKLTCDVEMRYWQGHGANPEYINHTAPAGTRVRIWMVSRFGDAGVTDKPNPNGYDARVGWDSLDDIEIVSVNPSEPRPETKAMVDRMIGKPKA